VVHFQQDITDITSKDVMEMMMMTQYFDTMQHIGSSPGNSTIFVPSGPGAVADAAHAVRSGIMQGNIGAAATIGR
jgi:endo-beta-N-acetylglucosaminidase D